MSTPPAPLAAFLAATPEPPYYAVIFTSRRTSEHASDYARTADRMEELARGRPGYLGIESTRGADGVGITVSYWASLEAIAGWRADLEHRQAQKDGRERFYEGFFIRVCRVERAYSFVSDPERSE
jgi:heme-degrading monooxygenase HmoA